MQRRKSNKKDVCLFLTNCHSGSSTEHREGVCVSIFPPLQAPLTKIDVNFVSWSWGTVMGFLSQKELSSSSTCNPPVPFPLHSTPSISHTYPRKYTHSLPLAGSVSHCCRYDSEKLQKLLLCYSLSLHLWALSLLLLRFYFLTPRLLNIRSWCKPCSSLGLLQLLLLLLTCVLQISIAKIKLRRDELASGEMCGQALLSFFWPHPNTASDVKGESAFCKTAMTFFKGETAAV